MNKKILTYSIIVICLITITLTFTLSNQNIETAAKNIKIAGLQGPTSIGMIKLIDSSSSISNVPTTYEIIPNTDILISKLQSNEFDIACLPVNLAANIYNKGLNYKILAVNTLNNLYVVGKNTDITEFQDLKGENINIINKGATPDILFNYIANKNGIDISKDINIDYSMQQTELASAIIANKVNFAILPEPFVSQVISKNSDYKILFDLQDELNKLSEKNINITQGCIVVNNDFAINNKKIVKEFIKEYEDSIQFVNNNYTDAGLLCEKYSLGVNSLTAKTAIPRSNIVFIPVDNAKEDITNFLKILYDFSPNSIGNKLPDEKIYYID